MKKLMSLGIAVVLAASVSAEESAKTAQPLKVADAKKSAKSFEEATGGFLRKPGKKTKKIYFINAQKRASDALIESARAKLDNALRVEIAMTTGTFDLSNPKVEGELSLYIVDDEKLPMSLLSPEARWGMVNVAPLAKGRGEKPQFFEARVRKEIARIGCLTYGGIGSDYKQNLLGFVKDAEALDNFATDDLPVDGIQRCERYLKDLGVRQWVRATYRQACQQGWAPAPTNEFQKAIWEKEHAIPDKPMKIEFDPAAQKGKVTK